MSNSSLGTTTFSKVLRGNNIFPSMALAMYAWEPEMKIEH